METKNFNIDKFLEKHEIKGKTRYLEIGMENITFVYIENMENKIEKEVNIGYIKISKSFFKSKIPTESEVENAINYIEDELMKDKELVSSGEELISEDKGIREILGNKESYSREEMEEIFTKYALLSMGQSAVFNKIEINHEKYAKLLVLREIMHHLNFKKIILIK